MHIEFIEASYRYKDGFSIEGCTFSVHNHVTIVGPNGSGKSTLAKALCGLLDFDGLIRFEGQNIKELSPMQRAQTFAYIPAKLEVFDAYTTVEEFVLTGRYAHKKGYQDYSAEDRVHAKRMIEELHIDHLTKHTLHNLSSGEQQLVLIAQALVQESKVLVFDEPTANLDPKNSHFFIHLLKKLKFDHSILVITHDVALAAHMDEDVVFMKEGKASFYKAEAFFYKEKLAQLYDAPFWQEGRYFGVAYD